MKFCVSTGVGTWMHLSTFEPDPDYSPEPENLKVEVGQQAPHLQQATGHGMYCREILFTPRCSPRPGSFATRVDFSVRRTVAELRGVKVAKFSDFDLLSPYKTPKC